MIDKRTLRAAFLLAPALLVGLLLSACGGGDGGSGGGTGTDESFVASVCKAGAKFQDDLLKAIGEMASSDNESEAAKTVAKPFKEFAASFRKANPPADLKDWHSEASKRLDDVAAALEKGNIDALSGDSPFPDPPQSVADRLSAVAEKNADCQKASLFAQ